MLNRPPVGYKAALDAIRSAVEAGRARAVRAITAEVVRLYWSIGRTLAEHTSKHAWGDGVIARLAEDLRLHFPDNRGFSSRNLMYMRALANVFPHEDFLDSSAARLPWGHLLLLLDSKHPAQVIEWYAQATEHHDWTQAVLRAQLRGGAHRSQGAALTNFSRTIRAPQATLLQQALRDPYNFEFLSLDPAFKERELEDALIEHLRRFMTEFGRGFAFLGRQRKLTAEGDEFFIDLLFYHIYLKRLVVIDLKIDDFRPEYAGKMAFYLRAVDAQVKPPEDEPSIGVVLCTGKNRTVVEYTLGAMTSPMAVAEYRMRQALPSEDQLQAAVEAGVEEFKHAHSLPLNPATTLGLPAPDELSPEGRLPAHLPPAQAAGLRFAVQNGSVSNKEYVAQTGVAPQTAARHLQQLVALGYLSPVGAGRSARYAPAAPQPT